jgi:large subunit ribosomal protein L9
MAKNVKLLLTESVEALGIVGDVVNVRVGYARNFLLPRNMATTPSDEAIKAVAAKRAQAERELAELRKQREELIKKLEGIEITIQRSCNDLGHLYASVTQQEIAGALAAAGYAGVKPRDVRLNQNIKRVDTYDVHIKFESDMDATVKLWVVADRKLDLDKIEEAQAAEAAAAKAAAESAAAEPATGEAPAADAKADKPKDKKEKKAKKGDAEAGDEAPAEKPEGDKADKGKKKGKPGKDAAAAAPAAEEKKVSTWGKPVEKPKFEDLGIRRPRRDRDDRKSRE